METMIDPFEISAPYAPYAMPPPRAPMMTMSIEVDFELDAYARPSAPDPVPESWGRVRCWCSEE